MPSKYRQRNNKPLTRNHGVSRDGNMKLSNGNRMYAILSKNSFNGFSGVDEFNFFPLRQLFLTKHKRFPDEWDTGYFHLKDIMVFYEKNKKDVLATHYAKNGKDIRTSVIYLGGKESLYVYLYDRSDELEEGDSGYGEEWGVCLLFSQKTARVDKLIDYFISKIIPPKKESQGYLHVLCGTQGNLYLEKKKIATPEIDFSVNYNADFSEINDLIIEKLSVNDSKGIVLLHGDPGTGKTTYIRYLINKLLKKVIYVPPNMIEIISDPSLVGFFLENSNSVLIIEDGENILAKRSTHSGQAIANILNLSDGLLSDCANIQIVATFNTHLRNIDEALLRKGRLIAKYEFCKLSEDRALKLSKKLGVKVSGDQTLAEIYNAKDKDFTKETKKVGFVSKN